MRVFLAMLLDSYRELNSKKLFWISLALSGVIVAAIGGLGVSPNGVKLFVWEVPVEFFNSKTAPPAIFYRMLFNAVGVKLWLAWIATILALITTAGMIPDFIAGGAIEMTLSRPVTRAKLFLFKYTTCLLFTALQVSVFTVAAFMLIGIRGGVWLPGLFISIPLVVLFYSYLFCVCALVGMITRSTIAALLVTMLFWGAMLGVHFIDWLSVSSDTYFQARVATIEKTIARQEANTTKELNARSDKPDAAPREFTDAELDAANVLIPPNRRKLEESRKWASRMHMFSKFAYATKTVLPKTRETTDLLGRSLSKQTLARIEADVGNDQIQFGGDDVQVPTAEVALATQKEFLDRSPWWILGTSLGFEAVILGIATLIFCRRDF